MELPFDPTGWFLSEKIDGFLARWTGMEFLSTSGNVFAVPDFFKQGLPKKELRGELFIGGHGGFERLLSTVQTGNGWQAVRFAIFDVPGESFPPMIREISEMPFAFFIPQILCRGMEHLESFYADMLAVGAEGVMLRTGNVLHKLKPQDDAEGRVTAHNDGLYGTGSLTVQNQCGTFRVAGLCDGERVHPPAIGSLVTYRHSGFTAKGLPKHPKFMRVRPPETIKQLDLQACVA